MNNSASYDIIGDTHGCHLSLMALLEKLGYAKNNGTYKHPDRRVIFLGDFIDRGPGQKEVIQIVRSMIKNGSALAVMGNHEFNAIAYATYNHDKKDYLRPHTPKNQKQHQAFLEAYTDDPESYNETIEWFKTLPLWLDLGALRIIHACWDKDSIDKLGSNVLNENLLVAACQKGTWQYDAIETLLKGKEIPFKEGVSFKDKDGTIRHNMRVRWWDASATNYRAAYIGPESARTHIPDDEIQGDHLVEYGLHEPPVFLGHYWFEGTPNYLASNIACVDYSVAKPGGKLMAYRWDGEQTLDDSKFISVDRQET